MGVAAAWRFRCSCSRVGASAKEAEVLELLSALNGMICYRAMRARLHAIELPTPGEIQYRDEAPPAARPRYVALAHLSRRHSS